MTFPIDEPKFPFSIRQDYEPTGELYYLRLHGRNFQNWWRKDARKAYNEMRGEGMDQGYWPGRPLGWRDSFPEERSGWTPGSSPDPWDMLRRLEALERWVRELERHRSLEKGRSGE